MICYLRVAILCACVGCGNSGSSPDAAPLVDAEQRDAGNGVWSFEVIETQSATSGGGAVEVELIRAHRPEGGQTYMLYMKAGANAPLIVLAKPYVGIDWSEEPVDARWAARGIGLYDDDDAPNWNMTDQIPYQAQTIDSAVANSGLYALQGISVIHVYGRFYAGGNLADDYLDSVAPYFFIESRAGEIDTEHIAAMGTSWGGMMTLFGVSGAPPGITPIATAAVAPPIDFTDFWQWTNEIPALVSTPIEAEKFFSPYLRRVEAATNGPPSVGDFSPYDYQSICDGLQTPVTLFQDDWDLYVPPRQLEGLVAACPSKVQPLRWHRPPPDFATLPMSHGPFDGMGTISTSLTFPLTHILLKLLPSSKSVIVFGDKASLIGFVTMLRDDQLAGGNPSDSLFFLREVADSRIILFDSNAQQRPGAEVLAEAFNEVYGTIYTATEIRDALDIGLPTLASWAQIAE